MILQREWRTKLLLAIAITFLCSFSHPPGQADVSCINSSSKKEPIKLGFLINADTSKDFLSKEAVQAANLAIDKINNAGGVNGNDVEVFIKSCDGPWGASSKQSVSLIYDDQVNALIGFVDGKNAHLAEQVATKSQVVFLSAMSPDPTLSKINIPWFFSSIYNADQQADALAKEIYETQRLRNIAVISSDDYDDSFLAKSFLKRIDNDVYPAPLLITHRAGKGNFKQIVSQVKTSGSEGIAFFGNSTDWSNLIYFLKSTETRIPVFCPLKELDFEMSSLTSIPVYSLVPDGWESERGKQFKKDFQEKYGFKPGVSSSFVYDGIMAICEAIKLGGADRLNIQQNLFQIKLQGITGSISFHPSGKRLGSLRVTERYNTSFAD